MRQRRLFVGREELCGEKRGSGLFFEGYRLAGALEVAPDWPGALEGGLPDLAGFFGETIVRIVGFFEDVAGRVVGLEFFG